MDTQASFIDAGMIVTAKVTGGGDLTIRGNLECYIDLPESRLFIEEGGFIEGAVSVREALIAGEIRGALRASKTVLVTSTGVVHARVQAGAMEIQDGAKVGGEYEVAQATR